MSYTLGTPKIEPSYKGRRVVYPYGPEEASVYVITKSPSVKDTLIGKPFESTEGKMLLKQLERAGFTPENFRLGSCVWVFPPKKHSLDSVSILGISRSDFGSALREDILKHPRDVIIAVGEEALFFSTGKSNILKHRGSVYDCIFKPSIKVIPVLEPEYIRKGNWGMLTALRSDLGKAMKVYSGGYQKPSPTLLSHSRGLEYQDFVEELEKLSTFKGFLSYDIEGWYPNLTCISFSYKPGWAISVPLNGVFPEAETEHLLELVKRVLENPLSGKVVHNALFDNLVLRMHGIGVCNLFMDTMLAHHTVFQDLPHKLDFVTSIYTWQNYYKDDRTLVDFVGDQVEADDYSCLDATVTLEIVQPLILELLKYGQDEFFFTTIMDRVRSASLMQIQGIPIDQEAREVLRVETSEELKKVETDLIVKYQVNPHSSKQTCSFLYTKLGLPKVYRWRKQKNGTKVKTITSDDDAIKSLLIKAPTNYRDDMLSVLQARKLRKALSTYIDSEDTDGRFFFSVNISGTPSGRYSIGKLLDGSGIPAQGIPKRLKKMVGVKSPLVIWECDSSQAEARVVAWRAHEDKLVDNFLTGVDIHKTTGVEMNPLLFGVKLSYEDVEDDIRQFYKKLRHALNYWMGPKQLQKQVNIEFPMVPFDLQTSRRAIDVFHEVNHKTYQWGLNIQTAIRNGERIFRTCLGRMRFLMGPDNDDLVRSAISFDPQATVADMVIIAKGKVQQEFKARGFNPKENFVFNQVHDSIVGVCHENLVDETKSIVTKEMEQPLPIFHEGIPLIIPAEFSVGPNWKDLKEV